MNIFCYPRLLATPRLPALLGIATGLTPQFGYRPRVTLERELEDRTEIDLRLGDPPHRGQAHRGRLPIRAAPSARTLPPTSTPSSTETHSRSTAAVSPPTSCCAASLAAPGRGRKILRPTRRPAAPTCSKPGTPVLRAVRSFELQSRPPRPHLAGDRRHVAHLTPQLPGRQVRHRLKTKGPERKQPFGIPMADRKLDQLERQLLALRLKHRQLEATAPAPAATSPVAGDDAATTGLSLVIGRLPLRRQQRTKLREIDRARLHRGRACLSHRRRRNRSRRNNAHRPARPAPCSPRRFRSTIRPVTVSPNLVLRNKLVDPRSAPSA